MKETLEIKLYMSELMYDVLNQAHTIGDTIMDDDTRTHSAMVQELEDNKDFVLRSFGNSFGKLKQVLAQYIVDTNMFAENLLIPEERGMIEHKLVFGLEGKPPTPYGNKEDNTFYLRLRVPINFNLAAMESIEENMHAYMVDNALASWLTLRSLVDKAQEYIAKAQECLNYIMKASASRIRPARVHAPSQTRPRQNETLYE